MNNVPAHSSRNLGILPDLNLFCRAVSIYSRKQALADGVQVDVSEIAKQAGFKIAIYLTDAVFSKYVKVPAGVTGQDGMGRLWDIMKCLHYAIRHKDGRTNRLEFQVAVRNSDEKPAELVILTAECSAKDFDDPNPAITIMLRDED